MSLHAWEWEDEDRVSMGPMSSMGSFYQSGSECDMEEYLKVKAQAQESDSEHPFSSESSYGPASTFNSDVPQVVPCKFIISLALPVNTGYKGKYTILIEKYRKHPKMDKPTAKYRRYYHIEYFLLPDDGEPKKVDMVVFPMVAKVFLDSGIKTVRPWQEGDKVWVSWTQTFNINMTKELLKKINFHKITMRVWDTKDKVSRKVKYYRLKTTGYSEDTGCCEEVKNLVLSQRRLSAQGLHIRGKWNQEDAREKTEKAGKHTKSLHDSHPAESETFSKISEEYEKILRMEDLTTVRWSISRETAVSLGAVAGTEVKELTERPSFSSLTNMLEKQKFQIKRKESEGRKKSQKRRKRSQEEEVDLKVEGHWKHGAFSTELVVMPLLAGWQTVVSRGRGKSASILDCFLTLKTEVPIMTEEQKQDLNPLTIKIKCVSCLPSQPVPHHELEKNITRAYQVSKKPPKSVVKVIRISAPTKDAVYNYSIQSLNSTELAKKELYREMAKEPRKRFTYSQNYLSAMVEPQDSEEEEKKARKKSRQAWLTANGFQLTGLHRTTECDHHLRLPPIGTDPELNEERRENAQPASVLDRERWSWDQRHQDFDLYKQPPLFLELPRPPAPKPVTDRKTKGSGPMS
ncbi:uncharacterized protein CFAP92 isoform X16 [Canis lupus baileyi]|uniref:uncharacterized protein KIAA1257 homolog isoform X14 n=1 Tax=Canis lupus familiaris TaxID=9615 RepID=UPI000BAA1EF0|nr:uncharacterized protein KIAA1257 homolog isoform X14 [Canis lupus familiaris]XP_038282720.1 uncharacterized protein KIAA1257 homolog isoform X14 [Canis lupus familiaris]XP_038421439.1 uncharacterized protein KIAA1257 homolog isoform X14 [Canis lupus familiaris]|eukprot:XP_022262036.1 uncharacterized protein KIAA1257 homolog isoform X13 [Canis lupus familiaris]